MKVEEIVLDDGSPFRYRVWDEGGKKGSVHINHGMAEHSARYDDFASFLAENGYIVWAQDHKGHGLNANGKYGFFAEKNGSEAVVRDALEIDRKMIDRYPELPHIVIGHSMGSFITRISLSREPELFSSGVVIGSGAEPGLLGIFGRLVASFDSLVLGSDHIDSLMDKLAFSSYVKGFPKEEGKSAWISRNAGERKKYDEDKESGFICTSSFYNDLITLSQKANSKEVIEGTRKDMPILFLSGSDDPVGDRGKGFEKMVALYRDHMDKVEAKLYDGARHEILNEICKKEVYSDILSFLDRSLEEEK